MTATASPAAGATAAGSRGDLPAPAGSPGDLPTALLRSSPADFIVEELPAYAPSGRGEHVFVTFRKTGRTTLDAVRAIALALGADPGSAGFAGMKDRHAITTQTASFQLPLAQDPAPLLEKAELPGIEVLAVARHDNKLKPGHLLGNRFRIALRGIAPAALPLAERRLAEIGRAGVPNAFGPQRFGRNGDNPERALAWIAGRERGPRDKREQRLLFSALQSLWFNEVLARREADGTWSAVLPGDLAKKRDSGGLFLVPLEGPELADAEARAAALAISATGPMFGRKMRWPEGAPGALEREVLTAAIGDPRRLDAFAHAGEGTRRPLRLEVDGLEVSTLEAAAGEAAVSATTPGAADDPDVRHGIVVSFVLPKGGYATTVLGRVFRLVDASAPRPSIGRPGAGSAPPPEADEVEEGQPAVDP
ncbi:tRNA pseudouridine(13) synthase TruD [Sorangium sp. So ce204]|uniref:tRNA pseudouridine(13) synthase TruD n=1 Tax=Sorangium sp. So ce204 TaxID=3133288 RepID=UPI003F64269D